MRCHASTTRRMNLCAPHRARLPLFAPVRACVHYRAKLSALRSRNKCLSGYSPPNLAA